MMASKRIWTDMFKLQHDTPALTQAESEERCRETRARWNPMKEHIEILESIFNSGIHNPNKLQIRKITTRLRNIGEVGDANVFYWFQNRKARDRKRQRRMDAAKEKEDKASSSIPTTSPPNSLQNPIHITTPHDDPIHITTTSNPIQRSGPNTIQTRTTNPTQTTTPIQTIVQNPIQTMVPINPIHMTVENPNFSTVSAPVSSFPTMPPSVSSFANQQMPPSVSFPTMPPSVSSFPTMQPPSVFPTMQPPSVSSFYTYQQMHQAQQVFADPFVKLQQNAMSMLGGVTTYPYNYNSAIPAFPQDCSSSFLAPENISYPFSYNQGHEGVMPSAPIVTHPDARLGFQSDDLITVTIDENAYRVPREPINVWAAFGPDKFLVDNNCELIPADDRGFTLHGLQDGRSYFVLG